MLRHACGFKLANDGRRYPGAAGLSRPHAADRPGPAVEWAGQASAGRLGSDCSLGSCVAPLASRINKPAGAMSVP
jgi:hypothetical protein